MFNETQNSNNYLGVDKAGKLGGDILSPIENQSSSIPDNFFLDFGFPPASTGHCWLKLSKDYLMLIDGGYETGNATSYMINFDSVRTLKKWCTLIRASLVDRRIENDRMLDFNDTKVEEEI